MARKPNRVPSRSAPMLLDLTMRAVENDLRIALEADATFWAGNEAISALHGLNSYGARTFNALQHALITQMALTAARLFESAGTDVASLSRLVALLRDDASRAIIVEQSSDWAPWQSDDGEHVALQAVDRAIQGYQALQGTFKGALETLQAMRTNQLAHSLLDAHSKPRPRLGEISTLLRSAIPIAADAYLAIRGNAWDPSGISEAVRHEADSFWRSALAGLVSSARI